CRSATTAGMKPLQHKSAADCGLLDIEAVDIELVVVFRVSDRSLQSFLDVAGDAAVRKGELGQRGGGGLAADRLGDEVELARAGAHPTKAGLGLGLIKAARRRRLTHSQALRARLSP